MLDSTELPDAGFCPDRMKRAARKQLSDWVSHRKVSEITGLKRRLNDSNFASRCEGWDLNPRTPARLDPESSAVDLAWLPSHLYLIGSAEK